MLKFTDVNLKLISDFEKYQSIESTISGGISMICMGCVEANNKFFKSYSASQPTSHIIYLDANNLHGYSQLKYYDATSVLFWR